jgi:D-glycero-alpha-D-manno-heptose-7-phosphate kinase
MIISKTPYRVSFFGGGTDYPDWYLKNGGEVISATIDKYLYLSIRSLPSFFEHKYRISYSKIDLAKNIGEIEHPVVREALKLYEFYKEVNLGTELHYDGDLPAKSGMGSSSVFVVGLLKILLGLKKKISPLNLAKKSIHFEQTILRETVGSQDQVAASYGGFNILNFKKNGSFTVENLIKDDSQLKILSENLLLVYTDLSRTANWIAKSYINKLNTSRKDNLDKIVKQTKLAKNLFLAKDYDSIGSLLHEAWMEKRLLSNKVSNNYIDSIYNNGLKNGALGGKLLGAGGGGFILFYVKKNKQKKFINFFKKLTILKIKFSKKGSEIIFNNEK